MNCPTRPALLSIDFLPTPGLSACALPVQPTAQPSAPSVVPKPRGRSSKVPLIVGGGCLGSVFLCLVVGLIAYWSGVLSGVPKKVDTLATFSPDGSRIAFTSRRKGNEDIFVMNADGTNLRQLTSNPLALLSPGIDNFSDYAPAWSPDGKQIAFTTARNNTKITSVDWNIYIMNADGSNPHPWYASQSTSATPVALEPAWSHDGKWIAFVSPGVHGNIYVYPAEPGSAGSQVTNFSGAIVASPSWSPDGKRIVFAKTDYGTDVSQICVVGADGSGLTQLTTLDAQSAEPAWSPDGQKIVFQSNPRGSTNIFVINSDGTGLTPLTHYEGDNTSPNWSPDGRRIIFSSSRQGVGELFLFVMEADGSNVVQLTK